MLRAQILKAMRPQTSRPHMAFWHSTASSNHAYTVVTGAEIIAGQGTDGDLHSIAADGGRAGDAETGAVRRSQRFEVADRAELNGKRKRPRGYPAGPEREEQPC